MSAARNPQWCGGNLAATYGMQYLGGFMGRWVCFGCRREAPYSWWRSFVLNAREEMLASSKPANVRGKLETTHDET